MKDKAAIPVLINVLKDTNQAPMVRHEAGEALGAIGCASVIELLEEYSKDPVIEVAETCQIALDRIKWIQEKEALNDNNPYASVDPSPPMAESNKSVDELRNILMDENESLFKRYRAMFSLRNMRTKESVLAIAAGLKDKSALFRHEIAFVLGQLQNENSIPHLAETLNDPLENEMVRHEAAEALGAIANEECIEILQKYLTDDKRVVKESCEVALDICDYEKSGDFDFM
jgi:deoxyhypusine monooxygenase